MRQVFSKLKVAHKLGVVVLTFAIPTTFILWSLISEQRIAIRFAAQEVAGARYLRDLVPLQSQAASRSLNGAKDTDGLATKLTELEAWHGTTLETTAQVDAVIAALRDPAGLEGRARQAA